MITIKCDCERENSLRNNGEAKRMFPSLLNSFLSFRRRSPSQRETAIHTVFIPFSGSPGVIRAQMWFEMSRAFVVLSPTPKKKGKKKLQTFSLRNVEEKLRWKFLPPRFLSVASFFLCVYVRGGEKETPHNHSMKIVDKGASLKGFVRK